MLRLRLATTYEYLIKSSSLDFKMRIGRLFIKYFVFRSVLDIGRLYNN